MNQSKIGPRKMKSWKMALLVALPIAAMAGTVVQKARAATSDALGVSGTIKNLVIYTNHSTLSAEVRLDTDTAPGNCNLQGGGYLEIAHGTGDENVIKALLAADLAGKTVRLRTEPVSGICWVSYVEVH